MVRWLYVRFVARDRSVWSWWLVPITLVLVLLTAAGRAGNDADLRYDRAEELLVDLPAGYRYQSASPEQERRISSLVRGEDGGESVNDLEARRITGGEEAFVVAFVADEEGRLDDVAAGFRDAGGKARTQRIGGEEFLIGASRGATVGFRAEANGVVALLSESEDTLRELGKAFADLP